MDSTEDGDDINWEEEFHPISDAVSSDNGASDVGRTAADPEKVKGHVSRMELNTNKAGMDGLDKEKINKIIMEASLGSKFYENERKKDRQVNQRIEKLLALEAKVTPSQLKAAQVKVDKLVKELERGRDLSRAIVHIDMDMFYAAVEMLEKPELRVKPMAVGSKSMLSTSNYVARQYGVRAGMPGFIGLKLCPDLVIVPTNFDKYRKYSKQVQAVLAEYDPNFSPMSLDEAYLDFTDHIVWRQTTNDRERTFCGGPSTDPCEGAEADADSSRLCSVKCGGCSRSADEETNERSGMDKTSETNNNQNAPKVRKIKEQINRGDAMSNDSLLDDSISYDDRFKSDSEELDNSGHQDHSVGEWKAKSPVTRNSRPIVFGLSIGEAVREMRFRIQHRTKLTASAGIAPNCMLAKIASDMNKPNGQYIIGSSRKDVMEFILDLPVRKISGIGKVMEKVLAALGVKTCTDLYQQRALLYKIFPPISFNHFIRISMGLGSTCLGRGEQRKSISTERTFGEKSNPEALMQICQGLCESLAKDAEKQGLKGRTLTLKTKTVGFEVKNRSHSSVSGIGSYEEIWEIVKDLLRSEIRAAQPKGLSLRLMGIRLSAFLTEDEIQDKQKQVSLMSFIKKSSATKRGTIDSTMNQNLDKNHNPHLREIKSFCGSQFSRNVGTEGSELPLHRGLPSLDHETNKACVGSIGSDGETAKTRRTEITADEQDVPQVIGETDTGGGNNIPSTSGSCDTAAPDTTNESLIDVAKGSISKLSCDEGHDSTSTSGVSDKNSSGVRGGLQNTCSLPHGVTGRDSPVTSAISRIDSAKPSTRRQSSSKSGVSKSKNLNGDILKFVIPGHRQEPRVDDKSINNRGTSGSGVSKLSFHQRVPECSRNYISMNDRSSSPVLNSGTSTFKASKSSFFGGILSQGPTALDIVESSDDSSLTDFPYGRDVENGEADLSISEDDPESGVRDVHSYLCPVCNKETTYTSLDEFNCHVDLCLNRRAISSMLKDQDSGPRKATLSSTSLKRQCTAPTSPNRKPRKKAKITTLDRFFMKNA